MLRLAWRGVVHNPARYIATLVAIITGVGFFAAAGFIADRVVDVLEGDATRQFGNVDAAIIPDDDASNSVIVNQHRIPAAAAEALFTADGVTGSAGVVSGSLAFLGADGETFANNGVGRLWIADDDLNPLDLVEGSAPTAAGQIVVDRGLAKSEDLEVGQQLTLLSLAGQAQVEVVGISRYGHSDAMDPGGTISVSAADAFTWLTAGVEEYQAVYLRGDGSQADLVATVTPLLPDGFRAQTGDAFLKDQRESMGAAGRYFGYALRGFAVLAMVVGGFVIYNTFNVIVTQRTRELAVMAAVGTTPRQLLSSLLLEGMLIGLLGSALGVLAGLLLTFVLIEVLSAIGISLAGSGLIIRPNNVIIAMLLGTIITVVSVMIPARRAASIEPIEALRSAAVESSATSRKRFIVCGVLLGVGLAGLLLGGSWILVALGALLFFFGVIFAGPVIAVVGTNVARPLWSLLGLQGRLAVDNAGRNPQRTATTSNALLIGVFLVCFVLVAGTSLKDFVVDEIRQLESADFVLATDSGTIDATLISDLQAVDGVEVVTPFQRLYGTVAGSAALISSGDIQAMRDNANLSVDVGSLDDLVPGTIALVAMDPNDDPAERMGSTVEVVGPNGTPVQLQVVAVIETTIDAISVGDLVVPETFASIGGPTEPNLAFIDIATENQEETTDAITARTELRPDIQLTEGNAIGRLISTVFDFIINAVNGLLAMSVLIALIGIVNTLSLSIIERRRELGLLRAVGMTDERVKAMVRWESVLIASLGTFTGMFLGIFFGWATIFSINRLADANIGLGLPLWTLLIIAVLGPILGLLASLIPAWRSTKLDVLESLAAT